MPTYRNDSAETHVYTHLVHPETGRTLELAPGECIELVIDGAPAGLVLVKGRSAAPKESPNPHARKRVRVRDAVKAAPLAAEAAEPATED